MSLAVKHLSAFRDMWQHPFFRVVTSLSLLTWLASVALLSVRVLPIIYGKTAVPLHYNIHIGVDTVGPWWRIYLVPVIGLIIIVTNIFLARFMWSRDPVLSHVAGITALLLQIVLLTATVFIVYLSLQYA